ncbi:MAG: hypothetical protein A3H97_19175 [Acidobacteria bacterium RIFCSPLOWO2_02_FULL_65_29]|nr:MAG: hypothetical protein A3H97_19175 [Acidobacteria bacterium RIFCSPLOWO2_02_FULL_65_29]
MTQPPATVAHVRSTIFPGGNPEALACTEAPTTAGLWYVRSSVVMVLLADSRAGAAEASG